MLRVAFVGTVAAGLVEPVRRGLASDCTLITSDEAGIVPQLPEVDVLVSMTLTPEMGRAASRLKLVQVPGAGLDRIDRAALPPGALLANVHGHETGIAEYVIGAMLTLTRDFLRLDPALRRGEWLSQWAVDAAPPPVWPELAGRTLGILGYGHIGQAVARRARAFDMEVHAIRRGGARPTDDDLAFFGGPESLDRVIERADYLLLALPASAETIGLLDRRRLGLMKRSSFLVNVARASVVDEAALYEALAERSIAGAALDVWYRYPAAPGPTFPATRPFQDLPNVLMTPHVSAWTDGMLAARAALIAGNIDRVAAGETPLNLVAR
jgi:phosphoglycerate dehydrogenase-like enzyme